MFNPLLIDNSSEFTLPIFCLEYHNPLVEHFGFQHCSYDIYDIASNENLNIWGNGLDGQSLNTKIRVLYGLIKKIIGDSIIKLVEQYVLRHVYWLVEFHGISR